MRDETDTSPAACLSPSRRSFLAAGTALAGTVSISGRAYAMSRHAPEPARLNAWVEIAPDDSVTLIVSQSEMGQGISTTLPAVLADELGADFARVKLEFAPYDPAYEMPQYRWMFTGNSESVMTFYDVMRTMGAAAREMLTLAAAKKLKVDPQSLRTENGRIVHVSGRSLAFGAVAADAAKLPVPGTPTLRPDSELRLVGRAVPRVDIPSKTDGSAVFGIDVKLPAMLVASIRRCPVPGGRVRYWDPALKSRPGVVDVVEIPGGLAVVSARWWTAKRALDEAMIEWDEGAFASYSTEGQRGDFAQRLASGPFADKKSVGDAKAALAAAHESDRLSAIYESPVQAHATMEPMNCTAHVTKDACEIWAPTQGVEIAQFVAMQVTGLPQGKVRIHRTLLGGGFGRRLLADFVKIAVIVAQKCGKPVKVIWPREEDFRYDAYRPPLTHAIDAVLGEDGMPSAMAHRVVSPSFFLYVFPRPALKADGDWSRPIEPPQAYDGMAVEGLVAPPYAIANYSVAQNYVSSDLSVSVWRTTGHGPNNFALESFIDELARKAGRDPLEYRKTLASGDPRAQAVLDLVADKSGWSMPLAQGRARGLALAHAFNGYIAQVVELSVDGKTVKLHRIVSAVDCGRVLDPGIAASNVEGGIVWGLSALRTEITFVGGRAEQSNFDNFDPFHLWETPRIEAHFIESGAKLGGLGEIGPVPTLAAVCNAIFVATNERIRSLPVSGAGFQFA